MILCQTTVDVEFYCVLVPDKNKASYLHLTQDLYL